MLTLGLIDTACKTAETGYLQRRIGKILESDHVASDGSVRDGENNLILPIYGGDGIDPESHVKIHIGILQSEAPAEDAARRWCGSGADDEEVLQLASVLSSVQTAFKKATGIVQDHLFIPFDPEVERPVATDPHTPPIEWSSLGPLLENACCRIDEIRDGAVHFKLAVRAFFTCRILNNVSPDAVRTSLNKIVERIERAHAPLGMMCGTIAAQSIGEPATQMTLVRITFRCVETPLFFSHFTIFSLVFVRYFFFF